VAFASPDAEAKARFEALLDFAIENGYAVEIGLIHYEGEPDMQAQAAARKARRQQKEAASG